MKILSLELQNYKRLLLNNVSYIKLTPVNKIQLIIGTNGSGKSSLLKELSPLPAVPNQYSKEGFKIIEISHNNDLYLLKSCFNSDGNRFHFIKNDEELNPGGTSRVYKELVKKEFNITNEIHEIMIGSRYFHEMSVSERRDWFTNISVSDFSYGIIYYQRLKELLRDIQGGIKLYRSRLTQESDKLLTEEEEISYRIQIKELKELITYLIESKPNIDNNLHTVIGDVDNYYNNVQKLTKELIKYNTSFFNIEQFESIDDIQELIITTQININNLNKEINDICNKIETNEETYSKLLKSNLSEFENIDKTIDDLTASIFNSKNQLKHNLVFSSNKEALNALLTIKDSLDNIFNHIANNEDKKINKDYYVNLLECQKDFTSTIFISNNKLNALHNTKKQLEHYKEHNQLECPKCKHMWVKGYDQITYETTLLKIEKESEYLNTLNREKDEVEVLLEEGKLYIDLYRSYINICRNWSILNPIWEYIEKTSMLFNSPKRICNLLESIKEDIIISITIDELNTKLKETIELKELVNKNQNLTLQSVKQIIDNFNKELFDNNNLLTSSKNYLITLNNYKHIVSNIENLEETLENELINYNNSNEKLIEHYRKEAISDLIQVISLELNKKENVISKIDHQKSIINDIQVNLNDLVDKEDVLKLAVKELSPSEGLIAKGLIGFINHFIQKVNIFIKKIWTYPLELLPISMTDNQLDLDYKFSIKINNSVIIKDVSECSSAMKEVIDLAFKVVSMSFLGLSNAPIFLDEFGRSFDKAHRDNAYYLIQELINSCNFNQVYIVSHYEHSYGSLKNSDMLVLCNSNINVALDSVFNKHVEIR